MDKRTANTAKLLELISERDWYDVSAVVSMLAKQYNTDFDNYDSGHLIWRGHAMLDPYIVSTADTKLIYGTNHPGTAYDFGRSCDGIEYMHGKALNYQNYTFEKQYLLSGGISLLSVFAATSEQQWRTIGYINDMYLKDAGKPEEFNGTGKGNRSYDMSIIHEKAETLITDSNNFMGTYIAHTFPALLEGNYKPSDNDGHVILAPRLMRIDTELARHIDSTQIIASNIILNTNPLARKNFGKVGYTHFSPV